MNNVETRTNLFDGFEGISFLNLFSEQFKEEMARQTKERMERIDKEIDRRAEERYQKKIAETIARTTPEEDEDTNDGHRKITVTYDPNGDVDDADYVKIAVHPEDQDQAMNDAVALLLAASKLLGSYCSYVDEDVLGRDFLDLLVDYMTGLALKKIGGIFYDGN